MVSEFQIVAMHCDLISVICTFAMRFALDSVVRFIHLQCPIYFNVLFRVGLLAIKRATALFKCRIGKEATRQAWVDSFENLRSSRWQVVAKWRHSTLFTLKFCSISYQISFRFATSGNQRQTHSSVNGSYLFTT